MNRLYWAYISDLTKCLEKGTRFLYYPYYGAWKEDTEDEERKWEFVENSDFVDHLENIKELRLPFVPEDNNIEPIDAHIPTLVVEMSDLT